MKQVIKNFFYQGIFQIFKLLLPIITIPIVSNALGPVGIGKYNYTNSIAQYFVLVAGLGVGVYGNREIAKHRDSKKELSFTFWSIFKFSLIPSVIALLGYSIIILLSSEKIYFLIQGIIVVAATIDISWFFMGMEDFKLVSLSSLISQTISFTLIVFFVKDSSDLVMYFIIQSVNLLVIQSVMWIFIRKKIAYVKNSWSDILSHFRPAVEFFIPKIAIILYTNLNKTILGWIDGPESVGYFTNTLTFNSVFVPLITTIDMVLLPRLSNIAAKGRNKEFIGIVGEVISVQLYFTIPMMFGISALSSKIVPWFLGDKFLIVIKLIPLVSPLLVIMPLGMSIARQYLVPLNRMKVYNLAVMYGALISVCLNLLLIPKLSVYGAIIATLSAEIFVTFFRLKDFLKETGYRFNLKNIFVSLITGVGMYLLVVRVGQPLKPNILTNMIQALIGGLFYLIVTSVLHCNPVLELINKKRKKPAN